jgi:hypothetical protein
VILTACGRLPRVFAAIGPSVRNSSRKHPQDCVLPFTKHREIASVSVPQSLLQRHIGFLPVM